MVSTARLAEIGALIGDPARAAMMIALLEGRPLNAHRLAERAGVTPQTASGHLKKLAVAGLISVWPSGRERMHRLASPEVGRLLEAMHMVAGDKPTQAKRPLRADLELRRARSCYDHLAGELAVALANVLGDAETGGGLLSNNGERRLSAWGLDLVGLRLGKRAYCRACMDWTERRPHLAGAVGAAMLARSLELGWTRRREGARTLSITPAGAHGFRDHFGVTLPAA